MSKKKTARKEKQKETKFVITPDNYYSPLRPHVSASQVRDFIRSRRYYFLKHVERSLPPFEPTPSVVTGIVADGLLTGEPLREDLKVTKKDGSYTQAYLDGVEIAKHVEAQRFWSEYSPEKKTQLILEATVGKTPVCGKLDILDIRGDQGFIDDIKCTSAGKLYSKDSWTRNCYSMGYMYQLAMYRHLCRKAYPSVKRWTCRHIVLCKEDDGLVRCSLFTFSEFMVDAAMQEVVTAVADIGEGRFEDPEISWNGATHVRCVEELNPAMEFNT